MVQNLAGSKILLILAKILTTQLSALIIYEKYDSCQEGWMWWLWINSLEISAKIS